MTTYLFKMGEANFNGGRVRYLPWERAFMHGDLRLPALSYATEDEMGRDAKRPTFKLEWPGHVNAGRSTLVPPGSYSENEEEEADLPLSFAISVASGLDVEGRGFWKREDELRRSIESCKRQDVGNDSDTYRVPLKNMLEIGLPPEIPEELAYHLAANVDRYGKKNLRPLNGMPVEFVEKVVDATFEVDHHHWATLAYLKQLAEVHWGNPLLQGFDTDVSDQLLKISIEAVRSYFFMLGETLPRDVAEKNEFFWDRFASYFFWTGRTGGGCVVKNAGLPLHMSQVPGSLRRAVDTIADAVIGHGRTSPKVRELCDAIAEHHRKQRAKAGRE